MLYIKSQWHITSGLYTESVSNVTACWVDQAFRKLIKSARATKFLAKDSNI